MVSELAGNMERNALLIYYALRAKGDHVTVLVGKPGIGKTKLCRSTTQRIADFLGLTRHGFLRWSVGQHAPEDFNGWPTPRSDGLVFEMPSAVKALTTEPFAVWLLDELGLAPRGIQGAALRLFDERLIGDYKLPDTVKLMAAMNPPEYSADFQEQAAALANRCVWLNFMSPSPDEHVAYIKGRPFAPAFPTITDEALDAARDAVSAVYEVATARGLVTMEEDCNSDAVKGRWPLAYATPRSWEMALNVGAVCYAAQDWEGMAILMGGTIGEPQARAFLAAVKQYDLIDPLKLARDPSLFEHDPKRPDRTYAQVLAVALACASPKLSKKDHAQVWNGGWDVIQRCRDTGADRALLKPAGDELVMAQKGAELLAQHETLIAEFIPLSRAMRGSN